MENKDEKDIINTYKIYWKEIGGLNPETYNKIINSDFVKELLKTNTFYLECLSYDNVQKLIQTKDFVSLFTTMINNACARIINIHDNFCSVQILHNYQGDTLKSLLECGKYSVKLVPLFMNNRLVKIYIDVSDNI